MKLIIAKKKTETKIKLKKKGKKKSKYTEETAELYTNQGNGDCNHRSSEQRVGTIACDEETAYNTNLVHENCTPRS
jgi:hypothetical protein